MESIADMQVKTRIAMADLISCYNRWIETKSRIPTISKGEIAALREERNRVQWLYDKLREIRP